ncbi:hypothetical protein M758_2G224100 [Ceratodon purpureus]|nr:hypothetical protein M758_2G224100 [Ceratodon purpureus]
MVRRKEGDMVDTGSVTLPVKIYERLYSVEYPDQQKVEELMLEFATKCKGDKKPGANRRFFVCIYCGKDDFSNKLRLNQHRYEDGCPEAKYPDGRQALLLPYPDFLQGQGKMVQSLVKGVTVPPRSTEIRQERTIAKTTGIPQRRDEYDEDFASLDNLHHGVSATKNRGSVTGAPSPVSDANTKIIGRTVQSGAKAVPIRKQTQTGKQVLQGDRNARNVGKLSAGHEVPKGKRPSGEVSQDGEETVRRSKRACRHVYFEGDGALINSGIEGPDRMRGANQQCTVSRQTSNFECEGLDTLAWASMPLAMAANEYQGGGLPLPLTTTDMNVTTKAGPATTSRGGALRLKLPKKGSATVGVGPARLDTVPHAPPGKRGADRSYAAPVAVHKPAVDKIAHLLAATETGEECQDEQYAGPYNVVTNPAGVIVAYGGKNQGPRARDTAGKVPRNRSVEEAISSMVAWEVEFDTNLRLSQYWTEGHGTPNPAAFHPELEPTLLAREEVLRDFERMHLSIAQQKSDDRLSKLEPPAPPTEPPMPGLYYLRTVEDAVELPWSWDCDGADDFRRKWDSSFLSAAFRESLMGCLWWWTAKKTDKNLPNNLKAVRDRISTSIENLVASMTAKEPYPELDALCAYVQWVKEYATYEKENLEFRERVEAENRADLEIAMAEFRRQHAWTIEQIVWDWCPFWQILMDNPDVLKDLPSLPWIHDLPESGMVRQRLLQNRAGPVEPASLVYVLKIYFLYEYGPFRLLACPLYGVSEEIICEACREEKRIMRAVSMFAHQGHMYFADAGLEGRQVALHRLKSVITAIRDGEGDDFVQDVMRWVRNVQFRALQDHATMNSFQFDQAWCAKSLRHWAEQWEPWLTSLRTREERDIGWVPGPYTPSSSGEVASLRNDIRRLVAKIAAATKKEDDAQWQCHERGNVEGSQQWVSSRQPEETQSNVDAPDAGIVKNKESDSGLEAATDPAREVSVTPDVSLKTPPRNLADSSLTCELQRASGDDIAESNLSKPMTPEPVMTTTLTSPIQGVSSEACAFAAAGKGDHHSGVSVGGSDAAESEHGLPKEIAAEAEPSLRAIVTGTDYREAGVRDSDSGAPEAGAGDADGNNPYTFDGTGYGADVETRTSEEEGRGDSTTVRTPPESQFTVTLRSGSEDQVEVHRGRRSQECPIPTLFPEIAHDIKSKHESPAEELCMTVTQVMRSVEGVQGVDVEAPTFEGSFSQWINGSSAPVALTPVNGVSIHCGRSPDIVSREDGFNNCPLNLSQKFQEEGQSEAVEHLIGLSSHSDDVQKNMKPCIAMATTTDDHTKETEGSVAPACGSERRVGDVQFPGLSLEEVYRVLKVDDLLKSVPRGGEGSIRKPETVFFNQCGKEIILKHKTVRDLKHVKTRLGNDIVDFAMSRLVWAAGENLPDHVHIVSSYVSSILPSTMDGPDEVEKFARKWLTPPAGVDPQSVQDLIIPWVCCDHWSILVLQRSALLHFDSSSGIHKPRGIHSEFWRSLSKAWQCLLGEPRQEIGEVVTVEVTQQTGNTECGHLSIRNAMLYLKDRAKDPSATTVQLSEDYLQAYNIRDFNVEMMVLLAKELDPRVRDTRYIAPFCPLKHKNPGQKDDADLLMNGECAPARKRRLRVLKKL